MQYITLSGPSRGIGEDTRRRRRYYEIARVGFNLELGMGAAAVGKGIKNANERTNKRMDGS